jgi:hypothetical protein
MMGGIEIIREGGWDMKIFLIIFLIFDILCYLL